MKQNKFSGYFCGHTHALGYSHKNGMSHYLSGAGGRPGGADGGSFGEKEARNNVYGFMKARVFEGMLYATYYYTNDKVNWKEWQAPALDLLLRREDHGEPVAKSSGSQLVINPER